LETRLLSKVFNGFTAVDNADLYVKRGTMHALIGPNGAVKTTCFNLLTKFLSPTGGQVIFNGKDITSSSSAHIARMSMIRSL
jgi:branched-chain amino acid transport system ATP-binding protein